MDKFGGVRDATDDNIIRRIRFASWISEAIQKRAREVYIMLIASLVFCFSKLLCDMLK